MNFKDLSQVPSKQNYFKLGITRVTVGEFENISFTTFSNATYKGCSRSKVPYFLFLFLGNTEINYQGENVLEVCTTTL